MSLSRALARVLAVLLLAALTLAGLAAAIASLGSGTGAPSFPWLAGKLRLPALSDSVGRFLRALEAPGGTAVLSAVCGLAAVLIGLALVAAILIPRRERRVVLRGVNSGGSIDAKRRPLADAAQALAEQARGVTATKVRVRPGRRTGGRLVVRADRPRTSQARAVVEAVEHHLEPLTEPFKLKANVQSRVGRRGKRVQ